MRPVGVTVETPPHLPFMDGPRRALADDFRWRLGLRPLDLADWIEWGPDAEAALGAKVLVVTTYDTETDVLPAIEAGATGYVLKDTPRDDLRDAVRAAAEGKTVLSPPVAQQLVGHVREPARGGLSDRELEILRLVADGATNKAVAKQLFISEATVKTHLLHAYDKLGVHQRAAAVAAAYERGLLTPGET